MDSMRELVLEILFPPSGREDEAKVWTVRWQKIGLTPSPPSDGGEGRGEEAFTYFFLALELTDPQSQLVPPVGAIGEPTIGRTPLPDLLPARGEKEKEVEVVSSVQLFQARIFSANPLSPGRAEGIGAFTHRCG
jgi:hypothetical protein